MLWPVQKRKKQETKTLKLEIKNALHIQRWYKYIYIQTQYNPKRNYYNLQKNITYLRYIRSIRFSLLISGQTILSYHPAVRLREPAQWAVLHLCMRILTSGLLVVVKNSSTRTWFRGGLCAGCRATYWFQKCVACFPKEVGCHYVCESLYFDMKRNWKGNCFERFWNTSSVISISYSDNQCNPIIIRGKCSLETCPDVKVTLSVTGLIMGHQVP